MPRLYRRTVTLVVGSDGALSACCYILDAEEARHFRVNPGSDELPTFLPLCSDVADLRAPLQSQMS